MGNEFFIISEVDVRPQKYEIILAGLCIVCIQLLPPGVSPIAVIIIIIIITIFISFI